jgi:hypothetical protein
MAEAYRVGNGGIERLIRALCAPPDRLALLKMPFVSAIEAIVI